MIQHIDRTAEENQEFLKCILKADERIERISNDIKELHKELKVVTDLTDVNQQVLVHFIQSKQSKDSKQ
jgi:hypothetical protein